MRTATKSINPISKSWTFGPGRTDYFYGGIVVCAHEQFCCLFSCSLFFHCRSFSPCWPLAFLIFSPLLWNFMSFFRRNSPPLFLITLPSSFSVIHVNEDIKINVDNTLLLFFLCKSPGGPWISRQKNLELLLVCHTCWLNYFALVYLWCGRTGERTVMWLSKFFGCIGHSHISDNAPYLPFKILHKHCFQFLLGRL